MNLRTQDHDLTIMNADLSKLEARPHHARGIYCGHNIYLGDQLVATADDAEEAEDYIVAAQALGKHLPSVTMPGYSDSPEYSSKDYARWGIC